MQSKQKQNVEQSVFQALHSWEFAIQCLFKIEKNLFFVKLNYCVAISFILTRTSSFMVEYTTNKYKRELKRKFPLFLASNKTNVDIGITTKIFKVSLERMVRDVAGLVQQQTSFSMSLCQIQISCNHKPPHLPLQLLQF